MTRTRPRIVLCAFGEWVRTPIMESDSLKMVHWRPHYGQKRRSERNSCRCIQCLTRVIEFAGYSRQSIRPSPFPLGVLSASQVRSALELQSSHRDTTDHVL